MKQFAIRLMSNDSGQDLIEYALLAGFISRGGRGDHECRVGRERGLRQRADAGCCNSWRLVNIRATRTRSRRGGAASAGGKPTWLRGPLYLAKRATQDLDNKAACQIR